MAKPTAEEAKAGKRFKPGQRAPVSGQYTNSDGLQVTMVKGKMFPPTKRENMTWKLTDVTR